jgi:hypothetical protein
MFHVVLLSSGAVSRAPSHPKRQRRVSESDGVGDDGPSGHTSRRHCASPSTFNGGPTEHLETSFPDTTPRVPGSCRQCQLPKKRRLDERPDRRRQDRRRRPAGAPELPAEHDAPGSMTNRGHATFAPHRAIGSYRSSIHMKFSAGIDIRSRPPYFAVLGSGRIRPRDPRVFRDTAPRIPGRYDMGARSLTGGRVGSNSIHFARTRPAKPGTPSSVFAGR